MITAIFIGILAYVILRLAIGCFFVVGTTERAVLSTFGRAQRLTDAPDPVSTGTDDDIYNYPQVRVIMPGPHFKWPWQKVHKVDVAVRNLDIRWDPQIQQESIEAVTQDNLTIDVQGQIRWNPSEENLYAYIFGVRLPPAHVMGYFISVLREKIATFRDPNRTRANSEADPKSVTKLSDVDGISINDLRKNLTLINRHMEDECRKTTPRRYGVKLDAALITQIDPPSEVDKALAAINTTHASIEANISAARADADQKIKLAEKAVEIATNKAQAEVALLEQLYQTLKAIKDSGGVTALRAYVRNVRLRLRDRAAVTVVTKSAI